MVPMVTPCSRSIDTIICKRDIPLLFFICLCSNVVLDSSEGPLDVDIIAEFIRKKTPIIKGTIGRMKIQI